MIRYAITATTLLLLLAGCGGIPDSGVREAAERIVKLGGSFVLHGTTVPIKSADKIPKGSLSIQKVDWNWIQGEHARDTDIELLKSLRHLEILNLHDSYITDQGMEFLKDLKGLRELDLHGSGFFSDKGLEAIQGLPKLSKLELSKTRMTDAAVDRLASMKQLTQLYLNNTQMSVEGGKKLRESLPNCKIYGPK